MDGKQTRSSAGCSQLEVPRPVLGWQAWLLAALVVVLQLIWTPLVGEAGMSWLASPLLAFVVTMAALRRDAWALVPVGFAILVLQPLLNAWHGFPPTMAQWLLVIPSFAALWFAGRLVRRWAAGRGEQPGVVPTVFAGVGGAIGFYLIANSTAWLGSAAYPQTAAGWWQAQSVGVPGFPPAWMFLRALIFSQLLFVPLWVWVVRASALSQQFRRPESLAGVAPIVRSR